VSSLHPLSKKDALHFIANVMNEEEAVGDVTSLATSKATRLTLESRKRKGRSVAETDEEGDDDDEGDDDEGEEYVRGVTRLKPKKVTRLPLDSSKRKVRSVADTDDEGDGGDDDETNVEEADDMTEDPIASVTSP
jgi:hypothetical protein